jgi:hypothetical protein
MSDTTGDSLAQRLVTLSSQLASYASSWEQTMTPDHPETTHSSDFVQGYVEKYDDYFERLRGELEEVGYDEPLFHFRPERLNAEHLKALADRLAVIASEVE